MNGGVTFRGFLVQTRMVSDDMTLVGTFATNGAANMRLSSCTPANVRIPVVGGVVVWSLAVHTYLPRVELLMSTVKCQGLSSRWSNFSGQHLPWELGTYGSGKP